MKSAPAEERDLEASEPMSPAGRLFREKHFNCYIVAVIGLGAAVDVEAARAGLEATFARHPRFSSVQVNAAPSLLCSHRIARRTRTSSPGPSSPARGSHQKKERKKVFSDDAQFVQCSS